MSPARTQTWTAKSEGARTYHEDTGTSTHCMLLCDIYPSAMVLNLVQLTVQSLKDFNSSLYLIIVAAKIITFFLVPFFEKQGKEFEFARRDLFPPLN